MLINLRGRHAYLLMMILTLHSCGSVSNSLKKVAGKYVPFYTFNKTELDAISVLSDTDSNHNLPVALDILFIADVKTAQALGALSGPDWFAGKRALLLRYQQQLVISELEIVPQSAEQNISLPDTYYNAVSVLIFANYLAEAGQYQADITQFSELRITLKRRGYALEELNP